MVINCTPHKINLVDRSGKIGKVFEPCGIIPRCTQTLVPVDKMDGDDGVPFVNLTFGEVYDLPEFKEETFLIVSSLVKNACPDRTDLIVPSELVRDSDGNIIGCQSFAI